MAEAEEKMLKHFRKPPRKRINYWKMGFKFPFFPPLKSILGGGDVSVVKIDCITRSIKIIL